MHIRRCEQGGVNRAIYSNINIQLTYWKYFAFKLDIYYYWDILVLKYPGGMFFLKCIFENVHEKFLIE